MDLVAGQRIIFQWIYLITGLSQTKAGDAPHGHVVLGEEDAHAPLFAGRPFLAVRPVGIRPADGA